MFPQPFPMLCLLLNGLNLLLEVNLKNHKLKMVKHETGVTVVGQRPGQLGCDVWSVFEVVSSKTHEGIWKWLVICRDGPVLGRSWCFCV